MTALIFDCETGPLPDDQLEQIFEYDETKVPGYRLLGKEFDPSSVKTGNTKDPAKKEAKIEEIRKKFLADQEAAQVAFANGRTVAWEEFKSRAALSAVTGRLLATGFYCDAWEHPMTVCSEPEETDVLRMTLETIESFLAKGLKVVGHNIINFDIPFLVRRAWFYDIKVPLVIINEIQTYRSLKLIDTLREWNFASRSTSECGKIDYIAKYFGVGAKNGSGADFHKLFFGTPEQREQAIDYLINDVQMTRNVAAKMNLI